MAVLVLTQVLDILVLVSSLAAFLAIRDRQRRHGHTYPPGPRPLPLIGNLLDIPKEFSWHSYTHLSKKHGDVLSLHVFGTVIVVLNSIKANKDLLESRGDIYSDRPALPIFNMMRFEWNLVLSRYNESFRQSRKLLDRSLRPAALASYRPMMEKRAHNFIAKVLANSDEFEAHLYHLTGSQILGMAYGYDVKKLNDRKVQAAEKLVKLVSEISLPGALLVNDLPFLRHIPECLSKFSYKPLARYGYDLGQEVLHEPMKFVRDSILNGTAQPSLALENLRETEGLEEPEREKAESLIANALGTMYFAGADTIAITVLSFFVAALLNPEIQKNAQEELDTVTKRERFPTFEDRSKLPYVDAICKEVMRWRPVAPLGVPGTATRDDIYEGFFIPKGAVVITNTWAILHNPAAYPEPESFRPERFINPDGSLRDDPVLTSAFGVGRRICPGRHLADATIFIAVASLLSVFNIKKSDGSGDGPDAYPYTGNGARYGFRISSMVQKTSSEADRWHLPPSRPCPFTCSITPRDRRAEELILAHSEAS